MNKRTIFWGAFWGLVALGLLFHIGGGWYFSGELIQDGFVVDGENIVVSQGDFELGQVSYSSPLGPMDAWYLPAEGSTWVIHVHGKGATPAEAEPMFAPIQEAGFPQLAITYRNDDQQAQDPSGYYQYGATEWEDVAAAVAYALENGADNVVLNGYSTGGAHVMSFMYRQNLDSVVGVHLDSRTSTSARPSTTTQPSEISHCSPCRSRSRSRRLPSSSPRSGLGSTGSLSITWRSPKARCGGRSSSIMGPMTAPSR